MLIFYVLNYHDFKYLLHAVLGTVDVKSILFGSYFGEDGLNTVADISETSFEHFQ